VRTFGHVRSLLLARVAAACAALIALAVPDRGGTRAGDAASPTSVATGRYVLRGTVRANTSLLPAREEAVDVLALVAAGDTRGDVRLHLRARGHACELRARISGGGALALEPGQTCRIQLDEPDARGHVDARLRSGSGLLDARRLSLDVAWDLTGSVTTRPGSRVGIPGTSVEVPLPAAPAVPVRGTVEAEASGPREDPSR
jgi:hypothetical protein